ncbi:hypothetical protein AALB16_12190 [Lachnospiraceae bacterium 62-35]
MGNERNDMALASMVLGIMSLVGICCCYGGLILGSLAIILGLLSRTDRELSSNAKAGIITGSISLAVSLIAVLVLLGIGNAAWEGMETYTGGIHV